jgi:two-component system NarL family sensor kinase
MRANLPGRLSRRAGVSVLFTALVVAGTRPGRGSHDSGTAGRATWPRDARQEAGRPRRNLRLLASGWLAAVEEDNEQVGSSRLDRPLSWLALATAVVAFGFFAGAMVLRALIAGHGHDPADQVWSQAIVGAAVAVPGVLIANRRPRHPVGWLLVLAAVWLTVLAFGYEYARYTFGVNPGALPGGDWWLWASRREAAMADYALPFFLLLFPTGHLPSPRWRPVAWLVFAAVTAVNLAEAFLAGDIVPPASQGNRQFYGIANPAGLFGDAQRDWQWISTLLGGLSVLAIGLALAGGIVRFHRSQGEERQQLKWVAYALAVLAVVIISGSFTRWYTWQAVLHAVAGVGFAAAVTIAVLKYRLYEIDVIINRTLVYLLLSGAIAGGYIAVVTGVGAVVPHYGLAVELLAAGLAAVVFSPLRARLQALVNRVMYGERDDPYAALSKLANRLDATLSADAVLPTIAASVVSALRSPYAAIEVPSGDAPPRVAAASGALPLNAVPLRVPLTSSGAHVGDLVVAPRRPAETFNDADRRLLAGLAHHAGAAVHAADLTTQLQRSRERLVTAREEERRRMRRDLHDGLGPVLAGIAMQLDAARRLMRRNPDAAGELLQHLREQTQAAITDIRRLVYELRPPALDDLGLIGALTHHAASCSITGGLQVSIDSKPRLPALPAAVEVAAYRIATEAVTNVTRHAGTCTATVKLTAGEGMLRVEVTDDGRGISPMHRVGVGLTSMRERAEELGGSCTLRPRPGGGSVVSAQLPLADPPQTPHAEVLPLAATDGAALPVTTADTAS